MSKNSNNFSPEVRERVVRMVPDNEGQHSSRWQAIMSVAAKIGCSANTLNDWVRKTEFDSGKRAGNTSDVAEKMKAPEHGNCELRHINDLLSKALAYFATGELDHGSK